MGFQLAWRPGAAALVLSSLFLSGCFGPSTAGTESANREPEPRSAASAHLPGALYPELAEDVRAEFLRAYLAYERLAGDHDELRPVSAVGRDFFSEGDPVAMSTIEALDTLYLMEFDEELARAVDKVAALRFDINADFQVFEAIIRLTGGLLSGYHATGDPRVLAQAVDFTDRLMPAFEKSPTGMPYRFVNLRTGAVSGTTNVLAEIGTCVTEFGYLSELTGDPRYVNAAKRALKAVYDRRSPLDLVGTSINIETGEWTGIPVVSTINPPVDSFFEYLFEGSEFLGDAELGQWYQTLNGALLQRQRLAVPAAHLSGGPTTQTNQWFSSVEYSNGFPADLTQSELAAFYAGLLAESGHVALARSYHDAWKAALDHGGYRVLPEELQPLQYRATVRGNQLRPEYVDAALSLWLVTGDRLYVERAVDYYQNMKATSRVANGYTILADVTVRPEAQGDLTPGYWFSENMKYYYLMFGRPQRFDYADHYMTTEGNVLRGLLRTGETL